MPRVAWIFDKSQVQGANTYVKLERNASRMSIKPVGKVEDHQFTDGSRAIVFSKKYNDPRLYLYHTIDLQFGKVDNYLRTILEQKAYSFGFNSFYVKIYQYDSRPDYISSSLQARNASEMSPKGDGTYLEYFSMRRYWSQDSEDSVKIWLDATGTGTFVEQTTGFTIDYDEGKITFDVALTSAAIVKANFVWKPRVTISNYEADPQAGYALLNHKYAPRVVLEEV